MDSYRPLVQGWVTYITHISGPVAGLIVDYAIPPVADYWNSRQAKLKSLTFTNTSNGICRQCQQEFSYQMIRTGKYGFPHIHYAFPEGLRSRGQCPTCYPLIRCLYTVQEDVYCRQHPEQCPKCQKQLCIHDRQVVKGGGWRAPTKEEILTCSECWHKK
jgi:hypothetical protein